MELLQIGDIIKNMRIENGYTQTQLAVKLGLQLSTLQKYENGSIVNIKIETLRRMCILFDIPPITFIFPNLSDVEKINMLDWTIIKYAGLNAAGANKAIEYINDLRKISDYQKS